MPLRKYAAAAFAVTGIALGGCEEPHREGRLPAALQKNTYEVWLIDQSDSPGVDHGGTLYVYNGAELDAAPETARPSGVVDLAGAAANLCLEQTGNVPVRPHMVLFNEEQTHAAVAFVASGHVVIFDAPTRMAVECLRMSESATGQQAHAAFPSPDGSYIIVANQNGKLLERIDTDFAGEIFEHNTAATLDLAACETPAGAPCEDPELRPDNAPICPVISADSALAFVTLRGGGLLVVDPRPTPMEIVAEYDMATVAGNGCGGIEVNGQMYVNSGGRPGPMAHLEPWGFDVYRFPLDAFVTDDGPPEPNMPPPAVVFSAEGERDSHGMVVTGDGGHVWVFDRHADVIEVIATADDRHVGTISLTGPLTDNAAPDLADISPDGRLVFVALRGPTPLSGDPHSATGSTPGLGIVEVLDNGRDGRLKAILPVSNEGADGIERADPHGLRVRHLD